jgi:translation initiation factor 2 beta subunit (eIF-2beta)/eIF-5
MKKNEKIAQQHTIFQVLHKALLLDGQLFQSLYEHEMQEHIAYWMCEPTRSISKKIAKANPNIFRIFVIIYKIAISL